MFMRFSALLPTILLVCLGQTEFVHAAQGNLTTTVTRTDVFSDIYGGCMAGLAVATNTAVVAAGQPTLNCPGNYVSFSCTGTYSSKDIAFYMFDQAQLALALNKQVYLAIDDTKKHNGYCFATRIDVLK